MVNKENEEKHSQWVQQHTSVSSSLMETSDFSQVIDKINVKNMARL